MNPMTFREHHFSHLALRGSSECVRKRETNFHLQLGFFLAAVAWTLAWNLDWRHYIAASNWNIRRWIRTPPPYGRWWQLGYRIIFFACFLGSLWQLGEVIVRNRATFEDAGPSLLYGAFFIGGILAVDVVGRWLIWRSRKPE